MKDSPRQAPNAHGRPPDATWMRSCVPLQSSQAANLLSGIFLDTFVPPTRDRMGKPLSSPCDLDPRSHDGQATPLWWRERSFPLTLIGRFLIVSIKPKEPSPLCTEDGSYLRGTHLAGQARGVLIDRQAMPLLGAPDIKPASSKCHIARRVRHQANAKSVCIPCLNVQFTATPRPGATSLFQ